MLCPLCVVEVTKTHRDMKSLLVFKLRLLSFSHISLLLSKLYLPALLTVGFE